jgi:DNA-binding HxlR family transcriptional regulator
VVAAVGCPINAAIEAFGDRWSLIILRDIVFGDRRYFRELQAGSEEGIASKGCRQTPLELSHM